MNADWDQAIVFVLKQEGGYTLDPNDRGGETNFGISKKSYPNEDIKNLTEARARQIYERDFWQACHCDELPYPLSVAVFDAAVNQGEGTAKRMLQISLGVLVDGILGEKTISAAFKAPESSVLRRFMAQRMARYARTILNDPTQEVFIATWSSRLMELAEIVFNRGAVL